MRVMGIVNVTPDSFSDGGLYLDSDAAIAHGRELAAEGADILDVGGESTRPGRRGGAAPRRSCRRIEPVVAALAGDGAAVSIDTSKAAVAAAALDAGAADRQRRHGARAPTPSWPPSAPIAGATSS